MNFNFLILILLNFSLLNFTYLSHFSRNYLGLIFLLFIFSEWTFYQFSQDHWFHNNRLPQNQPMRSFLVNLVRDCSYIKYLKNCLNYPKQVYYNFLSLNNFCFCQFITPVSYGQDFSHFSYLEMYLFKWENILVLTP